MNNQFGRSMIEMLGVLAIIGVLSVGGLDMVSKARRNNQIASLLSGISKLSATIVQHRQYFSEVKSSYGNDYALFLKQVGKLPDDLSSLGAEVTSEIIDSDNGIVVISAAKLDRETCIRVASNNWGTRHSSRFVGVMIDSGFVCSNPKTTQMTIAEATSACSSATGNTVHLFYKL